MKEHNYAFQNADERPRLESRTQNICFVISILAQFILKLMVIKIRRDVLRLFFAQESH